VIMEKNINSSLLDYEKDFISFQQQLPKLRQTNPNQFIAFKDNKIIHSNDSIEKIKEELISQGIEPSGIIIEFVSKDEIRMIV